MARIQSSGSTRAVTFQDLIFQLNGDAAPTALPGTLTTINNLLAVNEFTDLVDVATGTHNAPTTTWNGGLWGTAMVGT